ncbi:carboxypeptidase regulatory-like domain-containing protein [Peribacillus psychrosaccharolyticus]|uniref:Carboxypeptidase regulatory-like domain-containing protein n=1 Tax=Peribacillus psychrosaccharolyticus TaxID=1407 RepID=A0A974NJ62_PERPY|nr:carboxypeptidase regulatory-like domain-containing protein [Peribacillus psychrosaccharolyticus]MEC2057898.1 carboxypeptidase regulatory-like domain-containing protein [Peribacillus psychrosaccharolyticus]MED3744589.1 carboxypeptidase regulatory-like domain-containing protein [Peribacillus psychrosaccharolyticus]QQS98710.1 carboxypeptidase regulatory-like domain-containing protein [Peribacillus psychrosaccharolyticus]
MKNLFLFFSTFVLVLACGLAAGTSSAQASVPQYSFQTEDGKWDGEIGNPNKHSDLEVELVSPIYLKTSSGSKKLTNYSNVSVRLVNARTGKSTGYHSLADGKALFTGMKIGKYYVDVKDGYSSGKVKGKLQIVFKN